MYLDKQNIYSDGQALATGLSENVIDFGARGDAHEALWLGVTTVPVLTAGQSLTVEVQTSDDEVFSNPVSLASFNSMENAQFGLAIGQRLPKLQKRYSRLNYTVNGGATGTVIAYLTPDIPAR